MKREHKPKYASLMSVFPLFHWRLCSKCGKEFRREWGWSAILIGDVYLCRGCMPTREDAIRFLLECGGLPASLNEQHVPPKEPPPPPSIELVQFNKET